MKNTGNILSLKLIFALIALVMLTVTLFFGTLTFADALRGYEVWKQHSAGADWNTLNYPGINDQAYSYYVAWWSPGQWMVPAFFNWIFHISSIQIIQFLTIFICLTLALVGYRKLFEKLGFENNIIWISLICILTNQVFYWHSLMYYGGDLLLLASFPWFMLGILRISQRITIRSTLLFGFIIIAGLFLKNTYLVVAACAVSFLYFNYHALNLIDRIRFVLPYGFVFIGIYLAFNILHLSHGETPGTAHDLEGFSSIKKDLIGDLTYSFGSPFGTLARYTLILQKVNPILRDRFSWINALQILPFLLTFFFLYKSYKKKDDYSNLLVFFALPFFALFTLFNFQNKAVGYEMRHFAPVVFLFFPGIIRWMLDSSRKLLMHGLIISFCLLDIGLYALSVKKIESSHSYWQDYKLPDEDAELFSFISKWEKEHPNGLLIVEEYWQLSYAAFKTNKIVLKKRKGRLEVVSGMELEFPDSLYASKEKLKSEGDALIILQKNGKIDLQKDLGLKSGILLKSTSNYKVYLSKLN